MKRISIAKRAVLPTALLFFALVLSAPTGSAAEMLPKIRISSTGRGFEAGGRPYVPMGVNYFRPGTGWAPQLWKRFDAEATRRDFVRMHDLGVNCVRVFLSYGSFFTKADELDPDGLHKLDQLLAIAEEAGIYVHPTGPDHWEGTPRWARADRFADERMLSAQEEFWSLFAARYRHRSVLFAYDLLNEPKIRWDGAAMRRRWNHWLAGKYGSAKAWATAWNRPAHADEWGLVPVPGETNAPGSRELLDFQSFRESVADEWTRRQAAAIKAADPDALVTVGLIQWSVPALLPKVSQYAAFRPERQAKFLDFLEVHFYPLEHGFYEYQPADEKRNLAYLESVVREVARPGKPVVLAEFGWYGGGRLTIDGGRHPPASEAQQAQWCRQVVETTAGLATGWLNWGLYDHPQARDVTQLTGLLTVGGTTKEWGRVFRELTRRYTGGAFLEAEERQRPAMNWDACVTSVEGGNAFRREYRNAFETTP